MIVIVDDRSMVADAYKASFGREGVSVSGFSSHDFQGWVSAAAEDDVKAIDAFLIGECERLKGLAGIIKRRCAAAIIAMKEEKSLASTLELFAEGVDDVVAKPCHVREILARIEAITRRARAEEAMVTVDADIRTFRDGRDPIVGGEPLKLPRRELRILECLVTARSRSMTKAQIFSSVYGLFNQEIDENVIESHICKLRRRLRQRLGYDPIESRRHLGYRLVRQAGAVQE
ncbi:MAG: response regulator transcription factor [Hyphomicrobiaceae bacterium]